MDHPHRFRLVAPPELAAVEFEAADAASLMTRAIEGRQQLLDHGYVLLQTWSPTTGAWCDPRYQNEARCFEVRAYAVGYAKLWADIWQWCEDARTAAAAGMPSLAR